jgi:hypothetical protein
MICAARPSLSPELAFYFFPEFVPHIPFFVHHLLSSRKALAAWDRKYAAQCELRLAGHDLGVNDFTEFHERRLRGENHNPICTVLEQDDEVSLRALLDEGKFNVNSDIPRSIFTRWNEGKFQSLRLIEYAALRGAVKCFGLLQSSGAELRQEAIGCSATGVQPEIIQACVKLGLPFENLILSGIRHYHFSGLKVAVEGHNCALQPDALREVLRHKFKGLVYLLPKPGTIDSVAATEGLSGTTFTLITSAHANDPFMTKLVCEMDGVDVMGASEGGPFSTALHAAAAGNAVDALRCLIDTDRIDVNVDDRCATPLIVATQHNAIEAIRMLGKVEGINPNIVSHGVFFLFLFRDPL